MGQAADELSATEVSPYGAAGETATNPSADELRAQIDRQRSELGRDLEVLGDRVSPGRMVERRRAAMRQGVQGVRDRLMGVADSATSRIGDTASSVSGTAGGTMEAVGDRLGHAGQSARDTTQGAPLAVGLVAFGAGAIMAALLPTSDRERRMAQQAQPALERAAEEAGKVARQEMDELRPMAEEAVEEVKSSAQDATKQVKERATGATEEVRGTAKGATEQVKGAAQR